MDVLIMPMCMQIKLFYTTKRVQKERNFERFDENMMKGNARLHY